MLHLPKIFDIDSDFIQDFVWKSFFKENRSAVRECLTLRVFRIFYKANSFSSFDVNTFYIFNFDEKYFINDKGKVTMYFISAWNNWLSCVTDQKKMLPDQFKFSVADDSDV